MLTLSNFEDEGVEIKIRVEPETHQNVEMYVLIQVMVLQREIGVVSK